MRTLLLFVKTPVFKFSNMMAPPARRTSISVVTLLVLFIQQTLAYPAGAPISACTNLTPNHGSVPKSSPSPFSIIPRYRNYGPSNGLEVNLTAAPGSSFKGFVVQVRVVGTLTPIGIFSIYPTDLTQRINCSPGVANTLTHVSNSQKTNVAFSWTAPNVLASPNIEFIGAFVQERDTYWTNVKSFQLTDVCNPSPCQNGGTCFRSGREEFYCQCASGFSGDVCSDQAICREDTCGPSGVRCLLSGQTSTQFVCECMDGRYVFDEPCPDTTTASPMTTYPTTTVHPCEVYPGPCQNGGYCFLNSVGNVQCLCSNGYTGTNCEVPPDPCLLTPCMNGATCVSAIDGTFTCTCDPLYVGPRCQFRDPCLLTPCMNGATCVSAIDGTYTCTCDPLYVGPQCQFRDPCNPSPCMNNGLCGVTSSFGYTCTCGTIYTGLECQFTIGCASSPCQNGGECTNTGSYGTDYSCTCGSMYTGNQCQTELDPCLSQPCQNDGMCDNRSDMLVGYRCSCVNGYSGTTCLTPPPITTRPTTTVDPCEGIDCQNGGTCGGGVCLCTTGYGGNRCEQDFRPEFTNCPEGEIVSFVVEMDSNTANIDIGDIIATSVGGVTLPVVFLVGPDVNALSTLQFSEAYAVGQPTVAQAVDAQNGNRNCSFTIRLEDRQSPDITCPRNIVEFTTSSTKQVAWSDVEVHDFVDPSPSVMYSRQSGSNFQATPSGETVSIIVRATDSSSNFQECIFSVTVYQKEYTCSDFPPVSNADVICQPTGQDMVLSCRVVCDSGYVNTVGNERDYICIADITDSFWDPKPSSNICASPEVGNELTKTTTISFSLPSPSCPSENQSFASAVGTNITTALRVNNLCTIGTASACEFDSIRARCLENGRKRRGIRSEVVLSRKRRTSSSLFVDIDVNAPIASDSDVGQIEDDIDAIANGIEDVADNGEFTLTVDGVVLSNDPSGTSIAAFQSSCDQGQVTSSSGCVSCPQGTYYKASDNVCTFCSVGTYQDESQQTSCKECSSLLTDATGSTTEDDCYPNVGGLSLTQTHWILIYIGCGVAGAFIILLFVVLLCCCRQSKDSPKGKNAADNLTYLNRAFEDEGLGDEMQYSGTLSRNGTLPMNGHTTNGHVPNGNGDSRLIAIPSDPEYLYAEVPVTSFNSRGNDDYAKISKKSNGHVNSVSAKVDMNSRQPYAPPPPPLLPPSDLKPPQLPPKNDFFPPPPPSPNNHHFDTSGDSAPAAPPPPPPPPPTVPNANNSHSSSPSGSTSSGRRTKFQI